MEEGGCAFFVVEGTGRSIVTLLEIVEVGWNRNDEGDVDMALGDVCCEKVEGDNANTDMLNA